MNKKLLAEILKYSNPKVLYIVTWSNLLKTLFCPFKVRVIQVVGDFKLNQILWVEEVKVTKDLKTVYVINGAYYYYSYFDIVVEE